MTTREIIRVAGIGAGFFSRFHYAAWRRLSDVVLCGVVDTDIAKATHMAARGDAVAYDDVEQMLAAQPDVVDIIVPPTSHLALVEQLSGRVPTIICQKPFTTDYAQARAAVQCAEAGGSRLIVHENFRFQPWYRQIAADLAAGALGEVYQAAFRLRPGDGQGARAYLDRQPYFQQMPRFLVHETAIHLIDVFRFLFGEVCAVYADLRRLNPAIRGEDAGHIVLEFASGVRALIDANRLADHAADNRRLTMGELSIEGAAGEITLDGDGGLWLRRHGANTPAAIPYQWQDIGFGGDCVRALQQHVVSHLRAGTPVENTAREYLRNLQIEDAVYRSAASRARVTTPLAS